MFLIYYNLFFPLIIDHVFPHLCMTLDSVYDARQCEFFLPLWWIFFFLSLKYFWALFRDIIKSWKWFAPFQSCLNTLEGRNRRAFSLGLIFLHYQGKIFWILYLMPHEWRDFPVWLVRAVFWHFMGSRYYFALLLSVALSTPLINT